MSVQSGVAADGNRVGTVPTRRPVQTTSRSSYPDAQPILVAEDRTRWGPIVAGFFSSLGIFLILETACIWAGAIALHGTGSSLTTTNPWVSWVMAMIAFFLGGMVTGIANPVRGMFANFLNGFVIWALASTLIAVLSVLGAGIAFGTLGSLLGSLKSTSGLAPIADTTLKSEAGWAFLTLITTAAAAAIGSAIMGFFGPVGRLEQRLPYTPPVPETYPDSYATPATTDAYNTTAASQ